MLKSVVMVGEVYMILSIFQSTLLDSESDK